MVAINAATLFRGTGLAAALNPVVSNEYNRKTELNTDLASQAPLRPSQHAPLAVFFEERKCSRFSLHMKLLGVLLASRKYFPGW